MSTELDTKVNRILQDAADIASEVISLRKENAALRDKHSNQKKLSVREVAQLRDMYARSSLSQRQIAEVFDVNPATVSRIVRGMYWK